ncbi:serine protease [Cognatishimia sp. MH4019]|uniref:serine protease n=1 Tax=Cognatishimia sp. MH4019 TaxID=2854030 RepID=UPI001CD4A334|nr:serine protease [Cognatishimia sp. MH4019]
MRAYFTGLVVAGVLATQISAQDAQVWVQIEAQPTLAEAQERLRDYSRNLPNVNGFTLDSGWHAVALGPYAPDDAAQLLRTLRRDGLIPRDSFVALGGNFARQIWPIGGSAVRPVQPIAPLPEAETALVAPEPEAPVVVAEPEPVIAPDETLREARQSERLLSRPDREALQVALKWAGTYNAAIDGSFGRGTRGAMALWQEQNGYEPTGVLTTLQRVALLEAYNAVLDGMGLASLRDEAAGIEMTLPLGVVEFGRYEPPFVQYDASGDIDARVLLISQAGDQDTLFGLYDIMQTLEIVPLDGPRERRNSSFELQGENDEIVSYTKAELRNGQIKGFTLIWPAGDEERRTRILDEMKASFQPVEGVLDPGLGDTGAGQAPDLIAGLEIRKPVSVRSGFYVSDDGAVVTSGDNLGSCARITLDELYEAELAAADSASNVAVLTPSEPLAPAQVAAFQQSVPRLQSDVAVAGYPYGGALGAPTLTFGKLADIRGLNGEETLDRLALSTLPGDAGGPVIDGAGTVLGMLLPRPEGDRQLPAEVSFSADAATIKAVLDQAGVSYSATDAVAVKAPEDLTEIGMGMTVLVSCWD